MRKLLFSIIALCLFSSELLQAEHTVKIACVGNSITYGATIRNRDKLSYPAQLQAWLGKNYEVRNFGVSGATMLRKGDYTYWNRPEYKQALEFQPDIVIIKLGTNDSKPQNWKFSEEFSKDYTDMVQAFQALESKPRVMIALPVPVFVPDKWGIRDSIVRDQIIPKLKDIARDTKCQYIDLYTPLLSYKWAFPDDVHPNSMGAAAMVEQIYRALFHRDKMHSSGYLNTAILPAPGAECRGASAGWGEGKDWFTEFDEINKIGKDRKVDFVLLGNSITQGWGGEGRSVWSPVPEVWDSLFKPLNAANFGISGDRTQNILWRVLNGNFDQIKPKVVALEIGVNNFQDNSPKEIADGIDDIIHALQKKVPSVKIILIGPLPAGKDSKDPNRQKYKQVHQIIDGQANGKNIFYQNTDKIFIRNDGSLVEGLMAPDCIHLTAEGYRAWAKELIPEARRLLGR